MSVTQVNEGKKDWHDWSFISNESNREGLGEHGEAVDQSDIDADEVEALFLSNGYNAYVSDKISLNRSIPDYRHKNCAKKLYISDLPAVSIIIPFFNEHLSTLLRTLHSIVNRSPPELIYEIILVDDNSTKGFLSDELEDYVRENFSNVNIIRLQRRVGLIVAKLEGAKSALADVIIFLDAHTEVNVNWLPPLLEPIVRDDRTCTCPIIDAIHYNTFEYTKQDDGARGGFDWKFYYKRLPLTPDSKKYPSKPYKNPVMAGGLFAISSRFFWELGGYDKGLDIWGGEQFELSFKIWLCGGTILDIPCSRVGHIFRGSMPYKNPRNIDYYHTNLKRVAEVWMDEYKEFIYVRRSDLYRSINAGNLTEPIKLREHLQCKPFKWYMEEIAPDIIKTFPPIEPPCYAHGMIRSALSRNFCVDTLGGGEGYSLGLGNCSTNVTKPNDHQYFELSYFRDIRLKFDDYCFDGAYPTNDGSKSPVLLYVCHMLQGNQMWIYQLVIQNIYIIHFLNECILYKHM